jgi:hypothetical protein
VTPPPFPYLSICHTITHTFGSSPPFLPFRSTAGLDTDTGPPVWFCEVHSQPMDLGWVVL